MPDSPTGGGVVWASTWLIQLRGEKTTTNNNLYRTRQQEGIMVDIEFEVGVTQKSP